MEMEFDKEIDALLRSQKTSINDVAASAHLDADEISAFAAGAVSDFLRANYIQHLADCGRCRFLLSEAAAYEETPLLSTETVVEPAKPGFFAQLFSLPKLVYGMGALALVFAGLLGFTVLTSDKTTQSEVAFDKKVDTAIPSAAPESHSETAAASANTAANAALPASNTALTNSAAEFPAKAARSPEFPKPEEKTSGPNLGTRSLEPNAGAKSESEPTALAGRISDDAKTTDNSVAQDKDGVANKPVSAAEQKGLPPPPVPSASIVGAGRDEKTADILKEDAAPAKPKVALKRSADAEARRISGKSFQKKNGVWVDSAYGGGATVNVKRGSDDYEKLDGGVKSVASQLGGTVIVVSGGKAYKIQ